MAMRIEAALARPARRAVVALGVLAASFAGAHDLEPRHEARVTVGPSDDGHRRVEAILAMTLPPDPRTRALIARFDLNGSGALEPPEGRLLADALGAEVIGGFVLTAGGSAAVPRSAEGEASVDPEGRLQVVLRLGYRLDAAVDRIGVTLLERPARGRAAARPMHVGIEVDEGDETQLRIPPTWIAPGERTEAVVLSRAEPAAGQERVAHP